MYKILCLAGTHCGACMNENPDIQKKVTDVVHCYQENGKCQKIVPLRRVWVEEEPIVPDENEWFGKVRWHDDDIRQALVGSGHATSDEAVGLIRRKCEHHFLPIT